jgi:Iron-sulfur cluster binding domain of dihydroorotate dehydrogenase B
MLTHQGKVLEIRLDGYDEAAWIACPPAAIPQPGQYLSAWSPLDQEAALGSTIFAGEIGPHGFLAVPPIPPSWEPGTPLVLRGPLGRGFELPDTAKRLALVALGDRLSRLLPLGLQAIQSGMAVALFTDCALPILPSAMEVNPLSALHEAYEWADSIAIDLAIEQLENLRQKLLLDRGDRLPCPAQALVVSPMPCGGLADCGACGVPARHSWKMICQDGPVFNLDELEW